MIEENLQFVQDNVKYMGFGEKLHSQIADNIEKGLPEFTLRTESTFNNKKIEAELYFRKSDKSDMYFFNKYDAVLKDDANNNSRAQTFYLDNSKGITFKEAFNLLEGRAVYKKLENKNGEEYHAWVKMDFGSKDAHNNYALKKYNQNYGYDLDKAVRQLPIKDLDSENLTKMLMLSLTKGNVQSVDMLVGGKPQRMYIEANPEFKTVNVYDAKMKPLKKEEKQALVEGAKEEAAPAKKQGKKASQKV